MEKKIGHYSLILIFILALTSCQPKEKAIAYGQDQCQHCRMMIVEKQYGSELVSKKGKVYTFDSIECLIDYLQTDNIDENEIALSLVTSFNQPEALRSVKDSYYLHSLKLPSPMGMFLTAFESEEAAMAAKEKFGGKVMNWDNLLKEYSSLK
ncbi:hypothetical protein EO244_02985 [Ancylomarina salipaludis]|uniref:Nitrous oxide reductase n=1 Tax=Ancylomarina salipaludis TaxID=2501299 RepID=A0A4Q1JQ65_9BACT|nr:nitrous oxide reductase accessory protein NosL [Ancylomarina salipaludis]RXQ96606.1 hypothetical protein EO244_02985 [Ancylomarina salipaludis]